MFRVHSCAQGVQEKKYNLLEKARVLLHHVAPNRAGIAH